MNQEPDSNQQGDLKQNDSSSNRNDFNRDMNNHDDDRKLPAGILKADETATASTSTPTTAAVPFQNTKTAATAASAFATIALPPDKSRVVVTSKQRIRKKKESPYGPARPLSAYNFFFREERERWLQERKQQQEQLQQRKQGSPAKRSHLSAEKIDKSREVFSAMGKEIAKRWKALDDTERLKYKEMAEQDMVRYQRERQELIDRALKDAIEGASSSNPNTQTESEWVSGS